MCFHSLFSPIKPSELDSPAKVTAIFDFAGKLKKSIKVKPFFFCLKENNYYF